ncbi:MAG TPA: nucleoside deaminase [Chloroflexota bacterium]|nr:nucleoside deaminase [Chloroflexota bacterium]
MEQPTHETFLRRAIALARQVALDEQIGGPFGAVIVRDGAIVGEGQARVEPECDPTWHAEMAAIRDACRRLGTPDLSGCTMYTSCECCAMCHAACWRAGIARIYYAGSVEDTETYARGHRRPRGQFVLPDAERHLPVYQLLRDEMLEVWRAYQAQA